MIGFKSYQNLLTILLFLLGLWSYGKSEENSSNLNAETSTTYIKEIDRNLELCREYINSGKLREGLELAESVYEKSNEVKYTVGMALALNHQGVYYDIIGEPEKSYQLLMQGYKIAKELKNKIPQATISSNLGLLFNGQAAYEQAIPYLITSLKLREEIGDTYWIASSKLNLGLVYSQIQKYDEATKMYLNAYNLFQQTNDLRSMSLCSNNLGVVYERKNQNNKALEYYLRAFDSRRQISDSVGMGYSAYNVGIILLKLNRTEEAKKNFDESLLIMKNLGFPYGIAQAKVGLATYFSQNGLYAKSELLLKEGIETFKQGRNREEIKNAYYQLYLDFDKRKQYNKSIEYLKIYHQYDDSIKNEMNSRKLIQAEITYEFEKQKLEDSLKVAEEKHLMQNRIEIEKSKSYAYLAGLSAALLLVALGYFRFHVIRRQKKMIEEQKKLVDEKQKDILDSIRYASLIQTAFLPGKELIDSYFKESFILYKPKDIVAGDFYWLEQKDENLYFAVCDCTGHGIPGAMVSVVCNTSLNRAINEFGETEPCKILDRTRALVIENFAKSERRIQDGMDISLCRFHSGTSSLTWAGANLPIWIYRKSENRIEEFKPVKQTVGQTENPISFKNTEIKVNPGDLIYLFSDGYSDQFGGEKSQKMTRKRFRELIISHAEKPLSQQNQALEQFFETYRGNEEQIDDVCVMGVRV